MSTITIGDHPPLPLGSAVKSLARCVVRTVALLARREVSQPTEHLGDMLEFSNGSHGRVYRETVVRNAVVDEPAVLIVARGLYQWNHAALAHAYVRALWWVLALVSERQSIHYAVLPGLRRDDVLSDPTVLANAAPDDTTAWWRLSVVTRSPS